MVVKLHKFIFYSWDYENSLMVVLPSGKAVKNFIISFSVKNTYTNYTPDCQLEHALQEFLKELFYGSNRNSTRNSVSKGYSVF